MPQAFTTTTTTTEKWPEVQASSSQIKEATAILSNEGTTKT